MLRSIAPEGWIRQHKQHPAGRLDGVPDSCPDQSASAKESGEAWARPLAKVYEIDVLRCSPCGSPKKVLAVVRPEALRMWKSGGGERGLLGGRISKSVYLGPTAEYEVEIEGTQRPLSAVVSNPIESVFFAIGERVEVDFSPRTAHLLPAGE